MTGDGCWPIWGPCTSLVAQKAFVSLFFSPNSLQGPGFTGGNRWAGQAYKRTTTSTAAVILGSHLNPSFTPGASSSL